MGGVDKVRIPKYFHTNYNLLKYNGLANENNFEDGHFPDIFISKKGTGSPFHADSGMRRFYFQLLSGKKLWRLIPPSENWRAGPEEDRFPVVFEADIINPDFDRFPE